jgi:putative chitinase
MLNVELLRRLYPSAPDEILAHFASASGTVLPEFGISAGANRIHFFLAQIGHESGGLRVQEENLNYSAERMTKVWPSRFPTVASAMPFARNPEALANKVYGGRLGNEQPGDGFKYRGRGFIQVTGKDGYRQVSRFAGLDLVAHPDFASNPVHSLRVACAVWRWKELNPICDRGDFVAVTKRINGGTIGLQDRREWLSKVKATVPWPLPSAGPGAPIASERAGAFPAGGEDDVRGTIIHIDNDPGFWLYAAGQRRPIRTIDEVNALRRAGLLDESEHSLPQPVFEAIPVMPGAA